MPTFAELGYPAFTGTTWFALSDSPRTPAALAERINAEVRRGLQSPVIPEQLATASMKGADYDAATFARLLSSEIARWTSAVRSLSGSK